uniref:Uncharacterized protein n=1 Tax=Arundo donax TaxID=35708 RepID=A0A0A9AW46_ARUDO
MGSISMKAFGIQRSDVRNIFLELRIVTQKWLRAY